jgi:hypothetical protein
LDLQDWLFPVFEALLPAAVSRALVLRRARSLLKVWLRANLYAIEARRVDALDGAVRMLHEDMAESLRSIGEAVLATIQSGMEEKRQGEYAIARRLGDLDRQAQDIFDGIRTGESPS